LTDEEAKGLVGLGSKLVGGLPAQFLALLMINLVVVGGLYWHMGDQLDARERVLMKLVETCSKP
jgi:hypothetical protein